MRRAIRPSLRFQLAYPLAFLAFLAAAGCGDDDDDSAPDAALPDAALPDAALPDAALPDAAPADIADRLAAIPGLTVEELTSTIDGYRHFSLTYAQPVDHDDPTGATFTQRIMLLHTDEARPVVIDTSGYASDPTNAWLEPLAQMLAGNMIAVEHRYFGESYPDPADPQYLTIDQAAGDHHRIITALRSIYQAAWISTGASKGGMTATYHHRRYPEDIDGTVAFVAPLSFGHADDRYVDFLAEVGSAECRDRIAAFQRIVLSRRETLAPMAEALVASYGDNFSPLPGGSDQAIDLAAGEFMFQFWQYGGGEVCDQLPDTDEVSDQTVVDILDQLGMFFVGSDLALQFFGSYYYQSVTQLGYPRLPTAHLEDLLHYDPNDYTPYVAAFGTLPPFDAAAMIDMRDWAAAEATRVIYIYGEVDPWTAGAYPVRADGEGDVHRFTVSFGSHGSEIDQLGAEDQAEVLEILAQWTGVTPEPPAQAPQAKHGLPGRDPWRKLERAQPWLRPPL
jgi:PS-10 peptidase S37